LFASTPDPWKGEDPQPGDFDALLARIDRELVERHRGDRTAAVRILISREDEDALTLGDFPPFGGRVDR